MQKLLLMGDEAIAQGALDAGMSGIYAYPGTPSTEITEYVQHSKEAIQRGVHSQWSTNEKTAVEAAIGMSYAGKRAMACMKHVGLNVAADPFMNSGITGANGGLVIVSADDPSMHSSQNEQDSRVFADFALIPVLEPSNQQEAYDMAYYAFELSEKLEVPVMIRITTRIAHSRAGVVRKPVLKENEMHLPKDLKQFVLLPSIARKRYKILLNTQNDLLNLSETNGNNKYLDANDKSLGIIASGITYNYLMENFQETGCPYPIVKITQYPLPEKMIGKLVDQCDKILVLEDGYPFIEQKVKGLLGKGLKITGRLDGTLPRDGELNPFIIGRALGFDLREGEEVPQLVAPRPPALCKGCGHIDAYNALNEALKDFGQGRVMADIGCYTLGALEPFNAVNATVDMGASITMAKGAADAGLIPAVGVIGDSTFTHSGMTSLLDAVIENTPITVLILDNFTTGMTGGQHSAAKGRIEKICEGLGVDPEHIRVIKPLPKNHEENVRIIKEELAYNGVSVVIPRRECIQTLNRRMRDKAKEKNNNN